MNQNCTLYRTSAVLMSGLLVLLILSACEPGQDSAADEMTDVSVALNWYPWANHSGLYLALERGYFEDEGLNVEVYVPGNPEDGLKLIASGEDDFTISYQTDVLMARGENLPVMSVAALVQHPLNSIMSLASSSIEEPADLEGKSIGYPGIPSNEPLLETVLAQAGLTFEDIELVNVGFSLVPALLGGQVDAVIGAYWVHESILIEQEGEAVNVLKLEEWGVPDYYELLLVASQETVQEKPEMVEKFLRAASRGYADAESDPDAAIDALVEAAPDTDRDLEEQGIQLLKPYWTDSGSIDFGSQTTSRWETYAEWMVANGLLDNEATVSEAFTNEFVTRVGRTD